MRKLQTLRVVFVAQEWYSAHAFLTASRSRE
jgi:hypothetical protein